MKIEYVDINTIKPYDNNPRLNRRTINKLKELILSGQVEFNVPIVIDKDNVIVKGHSRWNALKELGYKIAPVIVSENTDEINNEDRIQDNLVQELSTWREDDLAIEMRENDINPSDYDIKLRDLGYKDTPVPDVTPRDIEKAKELFNAIGDKEREFIELICPYCGEEFMLDRKEIKKYV